MVKTKSRPSSKKKSVVKKSTLTRVPQKTSKLPIFLTILALVFAGSFYLYKKMVAPLGINEVTAVPACTNYISGPIMSKTSLNPGEKFTYTCAFTQADLDCNYGASSEKYNFYSGKFIGWTDSTDTIGSFEAQAPNYPGTYTAYCQLGNTAGCVAKGVSACNTKDKAVSYTVIGDPVPKPTGLKYECLNNGSRVKITWDAVTGNPGFLPRLNNINNDVAGQNWSVDSSDYMDDNHISNSLEKDIAPNAKYNFWIHVKGQNNSISESSNIVFSCSDLTCKDGFNDSFDSVNSRFTGSDSSYQNISNGQANFIKLGGRLRTTEYNGDFVSIIDISSSTSDTADPVIVARNYDDSRSRGVKIQYNKATAKVESGRITKPDGVTDVFDQWTSLNSSTKPASYKIVRKGNNFYAYFKNSGSDWKQLGTYDNLTPDPISIRFGSDNDEKTSFDNFSLSCIAPSKPAAPTNLNYTCTPEGTSVKLTWNGVDSDSYKVRLDDKNGKVTNYDVKQLQYITSITPNKQYSFWVHSHKADQDSNQSAALDFTCNVTSTPTPKSTIKPTVKPTVKPTSTPLVTPTPAPTTSTKTTISSPKPSAFAYENPATTDATADTTSKSTNPISRFFAWLASLFE